MNAVENVVPDGCYVEQVAYVSRHGSRYPDQGAYNEWVALYNKVKLAGPAARSELKVKADPSIWTVYSNRRSGVSAHMGAGSHQPDRTNSE